ncbi:MAG: YkgJ family cysteine cluster protein [Rhizonema sp. NSF051]|nr:YkgJ family cysteine cluster protein [Rhizonema sp. NSF051]
MAKWQCVKQCGACCHLNPADRPDLDEYLSPPELEVYLSMVGEEGWCINYDKELRECRIYANRPRFCRVESEIFQDMYGISPEELNDFAIDCCRQQIEGVYSESSLEMLRFDEAVGFDFC